MKLFITCLFFGGVLAVPVERTSEEICDPGKTRFLPNTKYTYRYVATSLTSVTGTSSEKTGHRIEAKCSIEGLGDCRNILRISDVKVMEASPENDKLFKASPNQESFKKALEDNSLFFTENNGRFEAIHTPWEEPLYVTNVKRGILSALQLQFTEKEHTVLPEIDVSGDCKSEYRLVSLKESGMEITKAKNLSQCSSRSYTSTKLNPVLYNVNSTMQGPLNSASFCRYIVDEYAHIKTLECHETHLLRPFSYGGAGVTTDIRLNLTLESTQWTGLFFDYELGERRRSNLLYEHVSPIKELPVYDMDLIYLSNLLTDLITALPLNETTPVTVAKFTDFVFALRKLNLSSVDSLWNVFYTCLPPTEYIDLFTKEQCEKSQSYLVDAFAQCGSGDCIRQIFSILTSPVESQLKPEHVPILWSGLNAVQKPFTEIFDRVLDLEYPKSAILSLGSLIKKYCQQEPKLCLSEIDVSAKHAVDFLEKPLPLCHATPDTVDDVILRLKALGNAGIMRSNTTKLVECALNANYLNVSVVAVETIRRMPFCPDTWKSLKWNVFADYGKDPELRIQAYQTLMMQYTSEQFVNFVAGVLDGEVNTQVGAFVFSHLKQMNDSVEPTFGNKLSLIIKNALKDRATQLREFNTEYKSRFMQKSFFNEESNLGFSSESSVIYHPESLLPRSAGLNVTLDLWGGAFPVLETNARFEGLEIIWEKLFGEKGYFPDNNIRGQFRPTEEQPNSLDRLVHIDELQSKVNLRKMTPSGFLSLKLFGNELDLFTLEDLQWLQEDDIPLTDIIELMQSLSKGINRTYTKSLVFMDETYVIPTCLGIPLNLSINGSAITSLYVKGKADLLNMFWGKKRALVKGTIKPSASILLSGKVTLDAIHFSSGVHLNGSIWTSTELQGNLTYSEDKGLKSHINVTEKPQEILNISTALFQYIDGTETPISGLEHRNKTGMCATDLFNSTLLMGLNLCSNISIPVAWYNKTAPFFPLTGPANFSIYLNKTDPLLTNIKLAAHITNPDKYTNKTMISVCTPGASHERKYFWNITLNRTEEMQRWNLSVGTHQENASTIDFIHVPLSQALNITVNATRNFTAFYFHRTCAKTHKIKYGLELNLTLYNRSLYHSFFVQNDTHDWIVETNTTLWNRTDNTAISQLYLNSLFNLNGNATGNVTLNITDTPLNLTFFLQGLHNMTQLSSNVSWNVSCLAWSTPILNNNMTINMTYLNTTSERKTQMNISYNGTQVMSCSGWCVNSTERNSTVFFCSTKMANTKTSLNMTVTNASGGLKICHMNVTHRNMSFTLNTTWMYTNLIKNVSLNMTYLNHSIVLSGSIKNYAIERGICFNSTYYNGTQNNFTILATCLSYVNASTQKSLVFNITSLNNTATVNTTWFANSTARGILVNCTYHNQTVFNLTATYANTMTTKKLHFNFSMVGNWSAELNHTFFTTESLNDADQIRSIKIAHSIKNGTQVLVNNSFMFSFFNTSTKKDIIFNFTFFNRTYGALVSMVNKTSSEILHHIVNFHAYSPEQKVTWVGVLKNSSKLFNLTSLLQYRPQEVLNHTVVWSKELNRINVSLDVLPNITVSFNFSGTFNSSINATANVTAYNHTLLWHGHVSNMSIVSNLTLWNRTIEFVTKTCNVSQSAFFKIRTWHHFNKTLCNGSVSFYINATERISYFNVSQQSVNYFFKLFSNNDTHINSTIYRINGSEVYMEWSREIREDKIVQEMINMTSVRRMWKALDNATFNIPSKLKNITLNVSLSGANMVTFRRHFKYVLKNITQELLSWNYTTENVTENIFNLTRHLLNVTSCSIPKVTAKDYLKYFHGENNTEVNYTLFYHNLAQAVYQIKRSNVSLENITEELILIVQNFTDQVNTTAVLGNLTFIIKNSSWFNQSYEAFIHNFTTFRKNITHKFSAWLNMTVSEFGNLNIANKTVNFYLKAYHPALHNLTLEFLNVTLNFTEALVNVSLIFRNFTHNVTEYFLNITHPVLFKINDEILKNISGFVNSSSFLGGVVYPIFMNFTEVWSISMTDLMYEHIDKNCHNDTSLDWMVHLLRYPIRITLQMHNISSNASLYTAIEGLFNESLAMYNTTVRSTACRVNKTHDWLVNVTDFVVMFLNDSVNVLNATSNKTTRQIIEFYINNTHNMTVQLHNMTIQLLTSTNFSKPLNESWVLLNVTGHYKNWTHSMPWTRPVLQKWNSTMFQLISIMRNHSWQNSTRYVFPKMVKYTVVPIESYIYMMSWLFSEIKYNSTVTDTTLQTTIISPVSIGVNYTQVFYDIAIGYMNLTAKSLNFTRNVTQFLLNSTYNLKVESYNASKNWTQAMYNLTFSLVNATFGFVNGSLVNETICHYAHLPDYIYFKALNMCNSTEQSCKDGACMVQQGVLKFLNKSMSPMFAVVMKLKSLSTLKAVDVVEWLQPQNMTAMTFGRSHIYTFDKRFFSIPSLTRPQCQYLVARDFQDGNFTIVAASDSITIITKDALLKIYRDGRVRSQGIRMHTVLDSQVYEELPVMFERTTVIRDGAFIKVNGDVNVECDMEHFVCSYIVSGFYHNRTAGLLGTNNGEPSDDWLSPSGKNRTRVDDFVNSWLLRGDEDCKVAPEFETCERFVLENRCKELFENETSPLSKCFAMVNPLDFKTACEAEYNVCYLDDPVSTLHCNTTAAYIRECKRHGIKIAMPDECSSCVLHLESNGDGITVRKNVSWRQDPSRKVDVVFVSSEGQSMESVVSLLPDFVKHLDKNLKEHQLLPQFGLVGFSGKAPVHRPGHVHTIKGQFLGDGQDFTIKVIENIEYAISDKEPKQGTPKEKGHPDSDGYLGLMKATEFPFRVGATKLFILITDSQRVNHSDLTKETVAEALKNISARLVVIGDFAFKKAIAVDTFGRHYVKKGEYKVAKSVLPQNDEYVQVLKETKGVAIQVKEFEFPKPDPTKWKTKKLFEIIRRQINDDIQMCKECICLADEVGKGKVVCKTCEPAN
ncbi:uncharacterized protein [Montipora capricornis]|uniref:uncharacterized protein n=1 Tax=Montipora capricornis TaxID=246305 RepID=UPI0035F1C7F7